MVPYGALGDRPISTLCSPPPCPHSPRATRASDIVFGPRHRREGNLLILGPRAGKGTGILILFFGRSGAGKGILLILGAPRREGTGILLLLKTIGNGNGNFLGTLQ